MISVSLIETVQIISNLIKTTYKDVKKDTVERHSTPGWCWPCLPRHLTPSPPTHNNNNNNNVLLHKSLKSRIWYFSYNSKSTWVWSGNTTITNCRLTHHIARKCYETFTEPPPPPSTCDSLTFKKWIQAPFIEILSLIEDKQINSKTLIRHANMSRDIRFSTIWYVRPTKPQISLRIRAVWSEPLLVAWIFYDC